MGIFLSYAHEDRGKAKLIAEALSKTGWGVWWDRKIPPGKTFDEVIEQALDRAQCVVVLWSKTSVGSHWVKAEATEGVRRQILVPALLDEVRIPLEFRRIQAADLTLWDGDRSHPEFEKFLRSISTFAPLNDTTKVLAVPPVARELKLRLDSADKPIVAQTRYEPLPKPLRFRSTAWTLGALMTIALLAGGFAWRYWNTAFVAVPEVAGKEVVSNTSTISVPSVIGLELDEAKTQLTRAGLMLGAISSDETKDAREPGTVVSQLPPSGERVANGTSVDVVVARSQIARFVDAPSDPGNPVSRKISPVDAVVNVPMLKGLGLPEARDRLMRWGLSVGRVTYQATSAFFPGTVISQGPVAGSKQARGSSVSLVIAEGNSGGTPALPSGAPNSETASAGGNRLPQNTITNFRATDPSPTELTVEVDAVYDGSKGTDQIVLSGMVYDGLRIFGSFTPLHVGAKPYRLAIRASDSVKEFSTKDVTICMGRRSPDAPEPSDFFHCQRFSHMKKWLATK
jgi:beta-lactam-binding protein with PASTA domain